MGAGMSGGNGHFRFDVVFKGQQFSLGLHSWGGLEATITLENLECCEDDFIAEFTNWFRDKYLLIESLGRLLRDIERHFNPRSIHEKYSRAWLSEVLTYDFLDNPLWAKRIKIALDYENSEAHQAYLSQIKHKAEIDLKLLQTENKAAVYLLKHTGTVVYVGSSNAVKSRIRQHISGCTKVFDDFSVEYSPEHLILQKEAFLIQFYKPKYNKSGVSK